MLLRSSSLLTMNTTIREKITPTFCCATCGTPLSGMESQDAYCSSCQAGIPTRANEQNPDSSALSGEETIFKFFCQQCNQKFSSPVEFSGRHFICPICSRENTVPFKHSEMPFRGCSSWTTTPAPPVPVPQDQFFPEFALEHDVSNRSSVLSEQLLLLDHACKALPQKEENNDAPQYNLDPSHPPPRLTRKKSHGLNKSAPGNDPTGETEPEEGQPIRITVHGENRTILPRRRVEAEPNELIPIRLGKEGSALPAPTVKQPNPIPREISDSPASSGREENPIDQFFGDEIEIDKIFPVTNTQV